MKSTLFGWTVLLVFALGCNESTPETEPPMEMTPEEEIERPYFDNGGFMLPKSHSNILRTYTMVQPDENGNVVGFNLDDTITEEGDEAYCREGDFVSPDGREGIDNQFADLWTVVEPLVGEAAEALVQGAVNEGRIVIVVELEGVDDLQNDEDVTLHIYRGRIEPDIGNLGLISPNQTVYFDATFPSFLAENVTIVDGIVEASELTIHLPVDILDAFFVVVFETAQIRFEIREDGTFKGAFGGVIDLVDIFDELLRTNAAQEAALVRPIFFNYADLGKGPDGCTKTSAAFEFEGTTAFSVRYPDPSDMTESDGQDEQ